jgi:hypothetical protein
VVRVRVEVRVKVGVRVEVRVDVDVSPTIACLHVARADERMARARPSVSWPS